jgi:sortase A
MSTNPATDHLSTLTKPGLHSYNIHRKTMDTRSAGGGPLHWLRLFFLTVGLCALGYYGFTLGNQYLYQVYENWAFDQKIGGRRATFTDWVMQQTPLGSWTGYVPPSPGTSGLHNPEPANGNNPPIDSLKPAAPPAIPEGTILGRVDIPRLGLSSIVRQGVSEATLSQSVGHVPSTQGAGTIGNFAIAAHRDTLFRALKDIKTGDSVIFKAPEGTFQYQVVGTQIVKPSDVSVLEPQGSEKLLTMITCYPFYFVGSAPKRFIVTARLLPESKTNPAEQSNASAKPEPGQ